MESKVELTIYDILGRELSFLVDESLPVGTHQVIFDAENRTSGTYIYALRTDDRISIKRMMLIK
ncbi:MAG: T9SS type A sorting domain-containing protein [Rhodothermaceae bacterium]|nr:T9SS type A sorting domain-containing protein [Rhodothermaceae bacterium]